MVRMTREIDFKFAHCISYSTSILSCGVHRCPSRCHQLSDHSKMQCELVLYSTCSKNHSQRYLCHSGPPAACLKCDRESKQEEKRKREEFLRQEKRDAEQRRHDEQVAQIDAQIARERDALRDVQLEGERKQALEQKLRDLEDAKRLAMQVKSPPNPPAVQTQHTEAKAPPKADAPRKVESSVKRPAKLSHKGNVTGRHHIVPPHSAAGEEWQRQKDMEGASNEAIDAIMGMVGLENVKSKLIEIKATLDLARRQGISAKTDRYNVCMLGNPGTGSPLDFMMSDLI